MQSPDVETYAQKRAREKRERRAAEKAARAAQSPEIPHPDEPLPKSSEAQPKRIDLSKEKRIAAQLAALDRCVPKELRKTDGSSAPAELWQMSRAAVEYVDQTTLALCKESGIKVATNDPQLLDQVAYHACRLAILYAPELELGPGLSLLIAAGIAWGPRAYALATQPPAPPAPPAPPTEKAKS